jgi:hypothetical protein
MKARLAIAANALWLLTQTGPGYAYSQEEVNLFESPAPQADRLSARQQADPTGVPNVESSYGGMPASHNQSGGNSRFARRAHHGRRVTFSLDTNLAAVPSTAGKRRTA